jgi:hypothetical protein
VQRLLRGPALLLQRPLARLHEELQRLAARVLQGGGGRVARAHGAQAELANEGQGEHVGVAVPADIVTSELRRRRVGTHRAWRMRNSDSSGDELTTWSKAPVRGRTSRTSCSAATATVKKLGSMTAGGGARAPLQPVLLNMWRSEPMRHRITLPRSVTLHTHSTLHHNPPPPTLSRPPKPHLRKLVVQAGAQRLQCAGGGGRSRSSSSSSSSEIGVKLVCVEEEGI